MDTIGRQVTTFVTLFMAIALIILMYVIFEPQRRVAATTQQRQESADRGAELFAKNCVVCHGPLGRGVSGAGFPLNVPTNRAPDEDRVKFLKTTISRGRLNSTGKLPNMPAWSNQEGGALGDQQIDDLINFLGYGDWSQVPKRLVALGTPTNAIPTPPGRGTPDPARVLALRHCIAAHHGADALPGRRFGSPEALALYRLNALDASVKGALEHGLSQ